MPISRRDFLKTGLAAAAVAITTVMLKGSKQDAASAAQNPASPPAPAPGHQQFTYRGRGVTIDETTTSINVMIDGGRQHIAKITPSSGAPYYVSHMFPFENFTNPALLVKELIDAEADMELFHLTQ